MLDGFRSCNAPAHISSYIFYTLVPAVRARPKSRIFSVQSLFTTMLDGFRSCNAPAHISSYIFYTLVPAVRARPKSRIFSVQSLFTTMLDGFRSCNAPAHISSYIFYTLVPVIYTQSAFHPSEVCSYNRPTYAPSSRTMAFTPQCSLATTHYFSSEYYQILIATHLPIPEGRKAELA